VTRQFQGAGVDETPKTNTTMVDVLSLEGFQTTLDARLDEAESVKTNLVELLRRTEPELGDLADARYVCRRLQEPLRPAPQPGRDPHRRDQRDQDGSGHHHQQLHDQRGRQTANAVDIADALGAISGTQDGEQRHA
jgi:hypothetical protein